MTLVAFATAIIKIKTTPHQYNVTKIYQCQGKAYDPYSRRALSRMLRVTNASMWEGRNIWGCEYAFVQNEFHEAHHPPRELIQIGSGCCDKCLTTCPEFRLKIERCAVKGFDLNFNITQYCTKFHKIKAKSTPPVSERAIIIQTPIISKEKEQPVIPTITKIGPYAIKKTRIQKLLTNPEWSLKQVEMGMQVNASAIRPECAPFLKIPFMDWTTWLQNRMPSNFKKKKDLTGLLGKGLGVLNTMDSEVLMNKLTAMGSNLVNLQQALQSSLLALCSTHWRLTKILPKWENIEEQDHEVIIKALGTTSANIPLALGCTQAQTRMQSVAAAVIREGEEGIFPDEIRKIVWDNASKMKRASILVDLSQFCL